MASPVSAVTVSISNIPSEISDQPFNIDVSVSGASAGTNYLRANLFQAGTTKYFGFTFNGTDFINSSDYSQYLPITIDSTGTWSGAIQAKLDPDSSDFTGPGNYSLKVRRYTPSGSSYTWSNEVSLNVNFSTPTPEPTPSPTLSPSPIPTPTPNPTPTPTPVPTTQVSSSTPKPKSTTQPTKSPTPSLNPVTPLPSSKDSSTPLPEKTSAKISYQIASVAAASVTATPSANETLVKDQKQINPFFGIGIFLLFAAISTLGYIYFKNNGQILNLFRKGYEKISPKVGRKN